MKNLLPVVPLIAAGLLASPAAAADGASQLTGANQWISPSEPGVLRGRVVLPVGAGVTEAVDNAQVVLVGDNGEALQGETDTTGQFVIEGVAPGIYALSARNERAFACCAMHVLPSEGNLAEQFPPEAEIAAANIDSATVRMAMIRYLSPQADETALSLDSAQLQALATQVGGTPSFQVMQAEGGLRGTLYRAGAAGAQLEGAGPSNVFVMQNGTEVARAVTDESGTFEIAELAPGNYSLLAVGTAGMASVGFELISPQQQSAAAANTLGDDATNDAGKQFVLQHGSRIPARALAIQCAPHSCMTRSVPHLFPHGGEFADEVVIDEGVVVDEGFGTPLPGGGYAAGYGPYGGSGFGGGGGGGGFLGGGGGLASLAGLAGLAGLAALDDDDDETSPSNP